MTDEKPTDEGRTIVLFALEQDEDGYPPVAVESVWANKTSDDFYEIDNIPFYAKGVSYKDVIYADWDDEGALSFKHIVRPSGHSTIRIIVFDIKDRHALLQKLGDFGCTWEGSHQLNLIAVDIPPEGDLDSILKFLDDGFHQERWEYEEASIVQKS